MLSGCSSDPEKLKTANDTFQKSEANIPGFSPLATGGVNLPVADNTYALPNIAFKKGENMEENLYTPRTVVHSTFVASTATHDNA